ncbi:MAG: hypothetical protein WCI62_01590 [Erysipelotrichaceae bacterium]
MESRTNYSYKLKRSAFGAIGVLILIYVLGIYTTLFIEIPAEEGWAFLAKSGVLLAHAVLGTLIIFHSVSLVAMSLKSKSQTWLITSIIGLAGILLSSGTGSSFVSADNDLMSFLMALGFAASLLAYAYAIYASKE